jgi:hypothetical protein
MPGVPLQAFWGDVPLINNRAAEFLGYPTQKPEVLLDLNQAKSPGFVG